jgi:hypothetical protein
MADDYSIIKRSDINTTLSDRSGFEQQTFLGASIRSFDCNAGFNNSSSTLNVSLVNDEYNKSDQTAIGFGADVYHNGSYDSFQPPVAGAPVFFAFGSKKPIDINDAWAATYYDTYKLNLNANFSDNKFFTFGGILQGYTQNEGVNGKPLYDVSIVDPREILSNSTLILSNYAGTTYNNKNLFNIFGFLEYEPSDSLRNSRTNIDPLVRSSATTLRGSDTCKINGNLFPLTGIGLSRRCEQGIPWYRISQALEAMFGTNGPVPDEYVQAGFGGAINFRGYNYIVDFGGLPLSKIPNMFFINQDQIDILSLVETLCTAISHEYFIRLLPVLNCDKTEKFYDYNQQQINSGNIKNIIAGIIRVDAIDKSVQPNYGALKSYLEKIQIYSDKKIGFELSNVPTDKFIVGAQTVDMYCFDGSKDRANNEARLKQNGASNNLELQDIDQWSLSASLKQQILPFFGFIGNKALTIPRGYGVFKQVMLDVSSLNCLNVGKYYVATEAEIQAAGISFEAWKSFLKAYDNVYLELTGDSSGLKVNGWPNSNDKFGISVPRCVFNQEGIDTTRNSNPCSPHFGFPLYYKRYSRLFIDEIIGKLISTRSESGNVDFQTWRQQKVHSISDELLKLN